VLPYFKRAEHNERGADEWHGVGGPLNVMDVRSAPGLRNAFVEAGVQAGWPHNPDFNGASQLGVGPYQATHRNGERCSAAKGYLTPQVRARPNLTVVTGAHTTRVLTESGDAGLRATGVEFVVDGPRGVVRQFHVGAGGEVVLSAGAFGSPQLLLLSGIGPGAQLQAHGLPVLHDLPGVGANFLALVDAVARRRVLPLGAVRAKRSLLYVGNLAAAVDAVLDAPVAPVGIHCVADAPAVAVPDLVRAIAAALGVEARLLAMPVPLLALAGRLAGRADAIRRLVTSLEVDVGGFRAATGWVPAATLEEGLAATARWWRRRHAL